MTFYRTDLSASPSPIDELLNKYENEQLLHSPHGFPPPMVIQLRAFLGEEGALPPRFHRLPSTATLFAPGS